MALTIKKRPYGYTNIDSIASTVNGTPANAYITLNGHGLTNGDVIYVKSSVENYNGFHAIEVYTVNAVFILDDLGAKISWLGKVVSADIYVDRRKHNWNSIHTPIVYKISNTKWPVNTDDTTRTMSSVTNSNGYCAISTSGDIKATGSAAKYEFVKVSGSTDSTLNGVWQIISYTNDTTFTLNIPYSTANDTALTGASVQYYYNNYVTKVQVWGGLNVEHEYYTQEPYALLATIDLIPDTSNVCSFSISEYIKKNVQVANNLLLGTLPNNLDAFTRFFIKYGEEYDDSDGTTLGRSTVSYTSDYSTFQGYAVNSKLPFKNIYSGMMTDYVRSSSSQKFLTSWVRPTIFSGQYFDISMIFDNIKGMIQKKEWYLNNVLQSTVWGDAVENFYAGVYRLPLTANCTYDRLDLTVYTGTTSTAGSVPSSFIDDISSWDSKTGTTFTKTVTNATTAVESHVSLPASGTAEVGDLVIISYTVTVTGTAVFGTGVGVNFTLRTSGGGAAGNDTNPLIITANGTYTHTSKIVCTATATRLSIVLAEFITSGTATVVVNAISSSLFVDQSADVVTETKTFDIDCTCLQSKATGFNLMWINNLGGFDSWYFMGYADHLLDVTNSETAKKNLFPSWPNSYGEFSDTVEYQTRRDSRNQLLIRSQNLTLNQLESIKFIKSSPLVQVVNSIYDRRTIIIDKESFKVYTEGQTEQYTIQFTATYTDDVASQTV